MTPALTPEQWKSLDFGDVVDLRDDLGEIRGLARTVRTRLRVIPLGRSNLDWAIAWIDRGYADGSLRGLRVDIWFPRKLA